MNASKAKHTTGILAETRRNAKMIGEAIEERISKKAITEKERLELIDELQTLISLLESLKMPVK